MGILKAGVGQQDQNRHAVRWSPQIQVPPALPVVRREGR